MWKTPGKDKPERHVDGLAQQTSFIGVIWTVAALAITVVNGYHAFGKKYIGPEIHIEDDADAAGGSIEARLQELRNLYDRSLITEEEYEAKKQEILKEL